MYILHTPRGDAGVAKRDRLRCDELNGYDVKTPVSLVLSQVRILLSASW